MRAVLVTLALLFAAPAAGAACHTATLDDAKQMMERAAHLLEQAGPRTAFVLFMEPDGGFIDGDLYVFVIDMDGVLWANGAFPRAIGSQAMDAQDSSGRYYIREMIDVARRDGSGSVEYEWYDPCSGEMAPKVSFFRRVGKYIVGAGAYGSMAL